MEIEKVFFDSWSSILKILIAAPVMYFCVVAFIRLAGKRSTSQMNNFDWIVTVAMGSIVGSGVTLKTISIADALVAVGVLLAVQVLTTRGIRRFSWLSTLAKPEPRLVVSDGKLLEAALAAERLAPEEVMAAIRRNGLVDLNDVQWVILETDANFSVIPKHEQKDRPWPHLKGVRGVPPERQKG